MVRIISLHISCSKNGQGQTASCIDCCVLPRCTFLVFLKRSGTYANESDFMRTASSHICCVLRCSGALGLLLSNWSCLFMPLGSSEHQMLWTEKKPILMLTIIVSFFSSSGTHQSHHLDGCQELVRFLLLFFPFEPCIFDNHHATYQI